MDQNILRHMHIANDCKIHFLSRQSRREALPKVPITKLPITSSGVAHLLADFCNGDFVFMDPVFGLRTKGPCKSYASMVTASHQCRSRCGANSTCDLEVCEPHSFGRHLVEVGSRISFGAKWANVCVAHVIDKHHNNVGRVSRRLCRFYG